MSPATGVEHHWTRIWDGKDRIEIRPARDDEKGQALAKLERG